MAKVMISLPDAFLKKVDRVADRPEPLPQRTDPRGVAYASGRRGARPWFLEEVARPPEGARATVGRPMGFDGHHPLLPRHPVWPRKSSLTPRSSSNGSRAGMRTCWQRRARSWTRSNGNPWRCMYQPCCSTKLATSCSSRPVSSLPPWTTPSVLEALPFSVAPPATPLLKRAARLGRELDLTFYDASFLALAVELDCPFITADRRLFERIRTYPRVRHLSRIGKLP